MIRNFLFRLLFIAYWVIGLPIYIITVIICWMVMPIFLFVICCPICWLFFGSNATSELLYFFDFDTLRDKLGLNYQDTRITPMWFPILFSKLKKIYRYNGCSKFL